MGRGSVIAKKCGDCGDCGNCSNCGDVLICHAQWMGQDISLSRSL